MLQNETMVTVENLVDQAQRVRQAGARMVTATGLDEGDNHTVIYHFDIRGELSHLRLTVPKSTAIPSISSVFPGAFLIENEMKELIGINITGMSVDYGGRLFMIEDGLVRPLAKGAPEVKK
jgi:ech hydrogenase subunit D